MKKILLFIDSLGAGGAQRQLVGLAAMLKEKKYDVKLITYHNEPFYETYLRENEVDYEYVRDANKKITRIFHIRRTIKQFAPYIVISYLDTPSIIACIVRITGVKFKLIVSERNTTQRLDFKERLKFLFYKSADVIISNSHSQQEFIRKNFPELARKTTVITNFVDLDYFTQIKVKEKRDIPRIIVVATIWPSKNTFLFIDALKILNERGVNFELLWFGKDNSHLHYYNSCQTKIEKFKLTDTVHLLAKTSDIKNEYLNADYFCLPSFYEGTPNVICEAISCGLPVICSDVCDNSIYVQEGVNGFLFDPHSPLGIADKMQKALELNYVTYTIYCQQSRFIAEQKLSKELFIDNYLKLINRLK